MNIYILPGTYRLSGTEIINQSISWKGCVKKVKKIKLDNTLPVYSAYIQGYSNHFNSLDDLKNWINYLDDRDGLTGSTLEIYKAVEIFPTEVFYNDAPGNYREIVIGR